MGILSDIVFGACILGVIWLALVIGVSVVDTWNSRHWRG